MKYITEGTSAVLTLKFTDERGRAATPSAGRYQISDLLSGSTITDWTPFTPSTSSYDLSITAAENTVLDSSKPEEVRVISVILTYTGSRQSTGVYQYGLTPMQAYPPILAASGAEATSAGDAPV